MSEEGAAAAAPAQDQNQGFFTGNIMNFERNKFDSRRENRLEQGPRRGRGWGGFSPPTFLQE